MPFILSERFILRNSRALLKEKINNERVNHKMIAVLVNVNHNYTPYIQELIYGYILMGTINRDIVKEFMPSEDCAARTIDEYLSKR
ncbi:hypothetical protein [Nicoliella lavandulae]|uniref:Uncharacterized protein n=1 Tax=Nicoliella lavandulae TaxID=3082954 RepID=A0ABU8SJT7_9LACO